jgi:hypothetical protein
MLQGNTRLGLRIVLLVVSACAAARPADSPLEPMDVCEILRDLRAADGKPAAVLGRYSYRNEGRWMDEQSCTPPGLTPPQLWLVEDANDGPRPPEHFEIDTAALQRKFAEMMRHTSLGKFRFGTPDYDRWAVVYGKVEARKGEGAKKFPANLVFRGSGVVFFLMP